MSQTFWESDTEESAQSELEMQQEPESEESEFQEPESLDTESLDTESKEPESHETQSQEPEPQRIVSEEPVSPVLELQAHAAQQPTAEPGNLALSVDDFSALEDRILRAVDLVKRERLARAEAESRAVKAEAQLSEQSPLVEHLQKDLNSLRLERDQVRQRVEKLLAQLDALEL
jgi:hypothetical protein